MYLCGIRQKSMRKKLCNYLCTLLAAYIGCALTATAMNAHGELGKGCHTLTIRALNDHIIVDQWMVDFKQDRKFYIIPVEK